MSLLDDWFLGEHTASGVTHPTYRKGSGPGVVVISEIPGITEDVITFSEEVVGLGCTVVMPHLFGKVPSSDSPMAAMSSLRQACINREFNKLRLRQTSAIADWLRSLARALHAELGGPGVGAVGMCFTGGFALAMMVDADRAPPAGGRGPGARVLPREAARQDSMRSSTTLTATHTMAATSHPAPAKRVTTPATSPRPTEIQKPRPGPNSSISMVHPASVRISPLVGTPVPAVTSTWGTSGSWLTDVPRSWRTASAMPFMPWM